MQANPQNRPILRTVVFSLAALSLGLWIGGLFFFGAILAPVAFTRLPPLFATQAEGIHAAGAVVAESLIRLHWMGILMAAIFLLTTFLGRRHYRAIVLQAALVSLMLALTCYSQFSIIPRMETARVSIGGDIEAVPPGNPGRQIFDELHRLSVRLETIVLICGFCAIIAAVHFERREVVTSAANPAAI